MYSVVSSWCCHVCLGISRVIPNSVSASSTEWDELWSWFLACDHGSIKVANLFNHFKFAWSGIPKVIENIEWAISQKWT